MKRFVDLATGALALAAAYFWWRSASEHIPVMLTYWGHTPDSDPFFVAMKNSARMNMYASILSGCSAFGLTIRSFIWRAS